MRSRLQPAIKAYHDLISSDLTAAEEQLELLRSTQVDRHITFGGRAMAHSLRPTFLTEDFYSSVQDTVYLIRQAILRVAAQYFTDPEVLVDELGMEAWEIELASIPTNVISLSATARMDSFVTERSFKFVELNAEVPAGPAYLHELANVYRSLPLFQAFERQHPIRFVSPLQHTFDGLFQIYREQFDGRELLPSVAIVDRLDVPTTAEFELIKTYLERRGHRCVIADPRSLETRDGWVYADGMKVDILYRRLLMNEFQEIRDDCGAYLAGYAAGKTCYLNSFRTKMVHKKAIFALLTDDRYTGGLSVQQLRAIRDHVPWTRRLRDRKTTYRNAPIDLIPFVAANRPQFVIKPNDGYGGSGVTLGIDVSDSQWAAAVVEGVSAGHVVQEVVDIHREPFLVRGEGGWNMVPTVIDLAPYINGPLMGGCLTRVSSSNLANVTAGGGTLPMFILRYA